MNHVDKAVLRIIVPVIVSIITAYYTVKHYDRISFIVTDIIKDIKNLF